MRGITTIQLGGETRTLSLKNNFLVLMGAELKCDPLNIPKKVSEIGESNPIQIFCIMVYCGMIAYYDRVGNFAHSHKTEVVTELRDGIEVPVTRNVKLTVEQVAEWIDDADDVEAQSVWGEFAEIMGYPKASEEKIAEYEEMLKKNSQQTKPSHWKKTVKS